MKESETLLAKIEIQKLKVKYQRLALAKNQLLTSIQTTTTNNNINNSNNNNSSSSSSEADQNNIVINMSLVILDKEVQVQL